MVRRLLAAWERLPWAELGWLPAAALTAMLGLYRLGAKPIWFDERVSLELATGDWAFFADRVIGEQSFAALHYSLLRLWTTFGQDLYTIRLLSVVFAVASIPVMFLVARRLAGPGVAVVATVLLATNALFIRYAQEARSYSLSVLLITLAGYLLLRLLEAPRRGHWLAYGISALGALLAHFYAAFVLLVHLAVIVRRGLLSRRALLGLAVILAVAAPLGWLVAFGGSPRRFILPITDVNLLHAVSDLAGGITGRETLHGWAYLTAATVGACLLRPRWSAYFCLAWLTIPWLFVVGGSLLWRPMLVPRYMILTLPALVLLAAAGLVAIRPRWLLAVVLVGFLALSVQGLRWWYFEAVKGRGQAELPVAHLSDATLVANAASEIGRVRVTGYESKGCISKRIRIEVVV